MSDPSDRINELRSLVRHHEELYYQHAAPEISDEEFADVERDVLAQIREINRARQEPLTLTAKDKLSGVEIETYQEEGKS